jgi:hypothetical protein
MLIVSNDALRVAILGTAVRPVQGWPLAGSRVVRLGNALERISRFNPSFDTFGITMHPLGTFRVGIQSF